jgi:hypothetical protein
VKVRIPQLIQDLVLTQHKGLEPTMNVDVENDDLYLDGPVSRRVAVLDFDETTGHVVPGARFLRPAAGRELGGYELRKPGDLAARDFNQVSVYATVLKTMNMFEHQDTLGRKIVWAFDAPQLLVVPRAGEMHNAFYERESHSLQFFFFPSARDGRTVYTSLSQDVVAHECTHAILDGIAPALYDALAPQSLALHEAVADLGAVVMSFRTRPLAEAVLQQTNGDIGAANAFSWIAEEFGAAGDPSGRTDALRSLGEYKTLDPADPAHLVDRDEPHGLSELLTSALYAVVSRSYAQLRPLQEREHGRNAAAWREALFRAAERFKRLVFRALDYLPPGEVSFADYARAIIACDQASHPQQGQERDWIRDELVKRHAVARRADLEVETDYEHAALRDMDLEALKESDWEAYGFVGRWRELLRVPADIPFVVHPRCHVNKLTYLGQGGREERAELLLKVSWDHLEPNGADFPEAPQRRIRAGTTLAIDWQSRHVRAILTSDLGEEQQAARGRALRQLAESGRLQVGRRALGPDGRALPGTIMAAARNGVLRVHGAARTLHIARDA